MSLIKIYLGYLLYLFAADLWCVSVILLTFKKDAFKVKLYQTNQNLHRKISNNKILRTSFGTLTFIYFCPLSLLFFRCLLHLLCCFPPEDESEDVHLKLILLISSDVNNFVFLCRILLNTEMLFPVR